MSNQSTVDSERWKKSLITVCQLYDKIMSKNEKWIRADFDCEFVKMWPDYLVHAVMIAWRELPDKFKRGNGRPKQPKKALATIINNLTETNKF